MNDRIDLAGAEAPPPPPLAPEVRAAIGATLNPVRPIWPRPARFAAAAGSGMLLMITGLSAVRLCDAGGPTSILPAWWWTAAFGILSAAALALTWFVVRESDPMAPASPTRLWAVAGAACVAFISLAFLAQPWVHASVALGMSSAAPGLSQHFGCLGVGLGLAAFPATAVFVLLRRGHAPRPLRAAVAGGIAASLWALVVLELRCPELGLAHKVVGHLGVVGALALVGAAAGVATFGRSSARA